jgi:DNA polymerase-3 subunit gamma/tau
MPAQALYTKYRPQTFDEIEGQEHIKTTLKSALALNRIAHAYLFTGPRGTGKTTTARVLAKAVNCISENAKPCNQCSTCQAINEGRMLDLIEIDAASNTSVDDVRDLRDKVDFRPGEARFKVYIIDEVHMLSNAAFNALLKTLEEPPPHVIFVLATTDPQKIPATVISRVQRFDFRRLTLPEIVARLNEIAGKEKIKIEPAAVELIARQATGAMRDAISLLDQLTAYGSDEISLAQVHGLLGASSQQTVSEMVGRLAEKDVAQGLTAIASAVDNGADPRQLARETVEYIRALMLMKMGGGALLTLTQEAQKEMSEQAQQFSSEQLVRAIRLFNQAAFELRTSAHPTLPLEIAFVEATINEPVPVVSRSVIPPPAPPASSKSTPVESKPAPPETKVTKVEEKATTKVSDHPVVSANALSLDGLNANWANVLGRVRLQNKMAEALLRDVEPIRVEGDLIVLGFHYQTHAERFEKQANGKALIEKALNEIFHQKYRVKCILSPKKAKLKAVEEDPLIRAAINQMGAEVTEIHDQPGA